MLKFLPFLSCWLITSSSICQNPPAGFPDTPTITEKSVGKARIGMPVAKLKELYKGCSFVATHMLQYGFDDTDRKPNGVTVSSGGQKLFIYYLNGQTKKVAGLLVFHNAYKTANGIHVGSTSGQLKTANPAVQVVPNMMLLAFQTAFAGDLEKPGIEYIFYKQKDLGKYEIADEPASLIAGSAKIAWLQIRANP